jgi:hypothetical protein
MPLKLELTPMSTRLPDGKLGPGLLSNRLRCTVLLTLMLLLLLLLLLFAGPQQLWLLEPARRHAELPTSDHEQGP